MQALLRKPASAAVSRGKTHFAEVARDLIEEIAAGRYPVGSLLPTELELVEQYRTSRHTVRAALHELEQLGFVSRRKKLGTRVEATEPKNEFRPSLASLDDLVQFGTTHLRKVQGIEPTTVTGALAKELKCPNGTRWLRISSLRVDERKDAPVGWTDVYLDPAYGEIAQTVREAPDTLISSLVESRYGRRVAEVLQEVRAITMPKSIAKALHVDSGTAALKIIRWYFDAAGRVFEVSVTVHPAERFSVSMRLRRTDAKDK